MKILTCMLLICDVSVASAFALAPISTTFQRTTLAEATEPIEITVTPTQQIIFDALETLYNSSLLEQRNALSRQDGYWPFLETNRDPPSEYTYGEFDLLFFAHLLTTYCSDGHSFLDVGSGTGRLVFAAAALMPHFQKCSGLEILPRLYECAVTNLERCHRSNHDKLLLPNSTVMIQPSIQFELGSLEDPYVYVGDADCIFCFSSCMPVHVRTLLAVQMGRQCRPGTIVMTTEFPLNLIGTCPPVMDDEERIPEGQYKLELIDTVVGPCDIVGGTSTVYIHRVESSMQLPRLDPPLLSLEQKAFRAVQEAEKLRDGEAFIRKVYNNMVFAGLPERFWPTSFQNN